MRTSVSTSIALGLTLLGVELGGQTDVEYQEWLKKEQQALQEFQDARDREFVAFLQQEWKELQAFQGIQQDSVPKPHVQPVAQVPVPAPTAPAIEAPTVAPLPVVPPPVLPSQPPAPAPAPPAPAPTTEQPLPQAPPALAPALPPPRPATEQRPPPAQPAPAPVPPAPPETPAPRQASCTFYGTPLTIVYDQALVPSLGSPVDKEAISAFWAALSRADYPAFLAQAKRYREQMQLNDWGYYQLLDCLAQAVCTGEDNQRKLLVWFLLCKSGYGAQIGYDQGQVFLLLPTGDALYGIPFFTLGGRRFYAVSAAGKAEPVENLSTYEGSYPGADQALAVRMAGPPRLDDVAVEKTLAFQCNGTEQRIPVRLNRNEVTFFADYPQTEYEVYFAASPSAATDESLIRYLQPLVTGKSETEEVNLLLSFVQTAFAYGTDDEQFGREKPLFPDETLYYPFSDCEDRSVLFAYLVRRLTGLDVIGLSYPGHVATAVRFSNPVSGDNVVYKNVDYAVCDPTYTNAEAGMGMPQNKGVAARVIPIGL